MKYFLFFEKNRFVGVTIITTFLALLLLLGSTDRYYAKRHLEMDAELVLFKLHDALNEANNLMSQFSSSESLECTDGISEQLSEETYMHTYIRWIGVLKDNEITCQSGEVDIDIHSKYSRHIIDDDFSLAISNQSKEGNDLFYLRSVGEQTYIANIEPFHINFLTEFACGDCVDYLVTLDGEPALEFGKRTLLSEPTVTYVTEKTEGKLNVKLMLRANKEFLAYYLKLGWATTILLSLLIALLLSGSIYKLQCIRHSLEHLVKVGLRNSEFEPFYQPIVDSRSGEVLGAEVLARWVKSDGTIIPPFQFIPFAEDSLLIIPITEQLIKKVASDVNRFNWHTTDRYLSINLVPEHLDNDDCYNLISELSTVHGIAMNNFAIEMTERRQVPDLAVANRALSKFSEQGIDIKIDDAGTGYGGFSYVQELPVSTLKIDKMFVDTILNKEDVKGQVLDAIIDFANTAGLDTIAEGAETKRQVTYLAQKGVYNIQGYYYAKPMNATDFAKWMSTKGDLRV
ncbi:MAG: cyclic diguanylate phosphodiesterase [Bacteroidetes bacterium]|nr:cyclic diguanylate phosphodiesterase [Bacteroidota bacterium]